MLAGGNVSLSGFSSIPLSLVKKNGNKIVCKKSLKCYCYKQDNGKSIVARSLVNDHSDFDEDYLEDGSENDFLESEEDFDDDDF